MIAVAGRFSRGTTATALPSFLPVRGNEHRTDQLCHAIAVVCHRDGGTIK